MSLPKLTKSRLKTLRKLHGWEFVSRMLNQHRPALRRLAQIGVELEKLTNTPKWRAGRVALARFRIMRGPQPKPPIPSNWHRSSKIGNWLKDHLRRIEAMAADAVCRAANGFPDSQQPEATVAAFNDRIAPIAKLYGFTLNASIEDGRLVLRGDLAKGLSVLTYLCSAERTPEIDWLLDTVTVFTQDQPFQWEGAWYRRLRHTKLGKWWRKQRESREQKATTQALIEHQSDLDRGAVREIMVEDMNRNPRPPGGRRVAPRPTMARQEGDRTNAKRFLGQTRYYPNVFKK